MNDLHELDDGLLRNLICKNKLEPPSPWFTDKLTGKIYRQEQEAGMQVFFLFDRWTWILIAGVAALVIFSVIMLDLSFISDLLKTHALREINILNLLAKAQSRLTGFFSNIHLSSLSMIVMVSVGLIYTLDRILHKIFLRSGA